MGLRSASSATHAYLLHFPFFLDKTVGNDSLSYHNGFKFGTFDKHQAAPKCVSKSGGSWGHDGRCAGLSNLNAGSGNISWANLDPKIEMK